MNDMISKETKVWDNYWKRGELHSCISASDKENQKEVNDFWLRIYDEFPDGLTFLDIGTGNGLLPSLAVTCANEKEYGWEIHGVDLADINPVRDVPGSKELLDQINFQGRIAAEDLPFESEYFDVVTSQYAIEYSDISRSIVEISRVLKKGGSFCAVLHSYNSIVVSQNNDNANEAKYLLDSYIFANCRELLSRILSGKFSNTEIQAHVDQYVENLVQLSQSYVSQNDLNIIPIMQNSLMEILKLSQKYHPQQVLEMVDNARLRLKAQRELLLDLVGSALDEVKIENLLGELKGLGFEKIKAQEFSIGEKNVILGYYIQLQKQ